MASYAVNPVGVAHWRELIEAKQHVPDSDWGQRRPDAELAAHNLLQLLDETTG